MAIVAIVTAAVAQSAAHLVAVRRYDRVGSFVDLDRSNGLPDILSTLALAAAALGAFVLARRSADRAPLALAVALGGLTVADLAHGGAHPHSWLGYAVILLAVCACVVLGLVTRRFSPWGQTLAAIGLVLLAASFLVNGLDRYDQWFERRRGDPVAEYQIVAKEGFELVGLSLVALALWSAGVTAPLGQAPTARASRAPARPTRHGGGSEARNRRDPRRRR